MTKLEYLDIAQLALLSIINPRDHLRVTYLDCFRCLTRELRMKIYMAATMLLAFVIFDDNLKGFYKI